MTNAQRTERSSALSFPAFRVLSEGLLTLAIEGRVEATQRELIEELSMAFKTFIPARDELIAAGAIELAARRHTHCRDVYIITKRGRELAQMDPEAPARRLNALSCVHNEPKDFYQTLGGEQKRSILTVYANDKERVAVLQDQCLFVSIRLHDAVIALCDSTDLLNAAIAKEFEHIGNLMVEQGWRPLMSPFLHLVIRSFPRPRGIGTKSVSSPELYGLARAGVMAQRSLAQRETRIAWSTSGPPNCCRVVIAA